MIGLSPVVYSLVAKLLVIPWDTFLVKFPAVSLSKLFLAQCETAF